jgi:hypothetical protein
MNSPGKLNKWNGCNLGLRLDNYASIDPDTKAAEMLCDTWEREGKLPPTWAWRTARGIIRRLFLRPEELADTLTIEAIDLQLRTGNKFYDVIPPSYVKDPKKGIDGHYTWLPDQDPESIDIAHLPPEILKYFQIHAGKRVPTNPTRDKQSDPAGTSASHLDVEAYLANYGVEVVKIKDHQGGKLFCLRQCVFEPEHQPNEAAIFQGPEGKLSYQCFHNSCYGRTWAEARELISGGDRLGQFMGEARARSNERIRINKSATDQGLSIRSDIFKVEQALITAQIDPELIAYVTNILKQNEEGKSLSLRVLDWAILTER